MQDRTGGYVVHEGCDHIFFVGFLGAGKSTLARNLGTLFHRPHVDTDRLVERALGKTVAQIFAEDGEDAFRDYLLRLDARKPVIVCGDMNVAHQEIDLKNPKSNRKNAGFTDEERAKFQQLLDAGFTDTFRYFYPDQTDIYSWWSYRFKAREKNAGWRIDYFVVSNRLRERLAGAKIHTEILGSDHCPVEVTLK